MVKHRLASKWFYILVALQLVFVLLIALPLFVLPYVSGTDEFRLKTEPIDPYDQFYGYYATLNYEISRLPLRLYDLDPAQLKVGDAIYVTIVKTKKGYYDAKYVSRTMPIAKDGEKVLKARITGLDSFISENHQPEMTVIYGFERFYGSEAAVKELEYQFQQINDPDSQLAFAVIEESPWGSWLPWAQYHVKNIEFINE